MQDSVAVAEVTVGVEVTGDHALAASRKQVRFVPSILTYRRSRSTASDGRRVRTVSEATLD